MMVMRLIHWLGGETTEQHQAKEKSKERLETARQKHAEACERHEQVYAEASKSAEEMKELTAEASECFAYHVAASSSNNLQAVKETGGENLP